MKVRAFGNLVLASVMILAGAAHSQEGSIASRETADNYLSDVNPNPSGYAKWVRIDVQGSILPGGVTAVGLNDQFQGVQFKVDLNIDEDDNPATLPNDVFFARGEDSMMLSSRPGEPGSNDLSFYIKLKRPDGGTPYPDGVGWDTDLRPRIQMTNSGELKIVYSDGSAYFIQIESDLFPVRDGITPAIRTAAFYDDGSGATAAEEGLHSGNTLACDGFVDRVDLYWSEPMQPANTGIDMLLFPDLGPTVYDLEGIGTWAKWRGAQDNRDSTWRVFTLPLISELPNTGIFVEYDSTGMPAVISYDPTGANINDKFREADTSQNQYYAEKHKQVLADSAGPAVVHARTIRDYDRQPIAAALQDKEILVQFSEWVRRSSIDDADFYVETDAAAPNPITRLVRPAARDTNIYVFELTADFLSENETGKIVLVAADTLSDMVIPPNRNCVPPDTTIILDGILPIILEVHTVDALPNQLAGGGANGWGYLDYLFVTFDHEMDTTKQSAQGFSLSGETRGVEATGLTGSWLANSMIFRLPLTATDPLQANTDIMPTLAYDNIGMTNGLRQAFQTNVFNMGLAEDLRSFVAEDSAGPAIIDAYTAGIKRIRIQFSESVDTETWPKASNAPAVPGRFKWTVGNSHWDIGAPRIYFTGLSADVVYLNHTGATSWTKTDSGAINFFAVDRVFDLRGVGNDQWDDDGSLIQPAHELRGSDVKVKRDIIPPILLQLETVDIDNNGKLDHYQFVFDPLSPPHPLTTFFADDWIINGYDGFKEDMQVNLDIYRPASAVFQPGAINAFGDTVQVYVQFAETTGPGAVPAPYGGDTGDLPDVIVEEGKGFADWADNVMDPLPPFFTLEKDRAGPAIMSARTINTTQAQVFLSEDLNNTATAGVAVEPADFALDMGFNTQVGEPVARAVEVAPGKVLLTVYDQLYWLPDQAGTVAFSAQNAVFDNISGVDNGNLQLAQIPVNDNAASQFAINLMPVPDEPVFSGVPFQISVIALDSRGEVDENFPELIRFSSNLSDSEIDLPDGPQPLDNGSGNFHMTCWTTVDTLEITVSVNSDRYARFFSTSDPIQVVESTIDAPDTLIVTDYRGEDGEGDQGGVVYLTFDYSDNHPGIGSNNLVSYYQIYREFDNKVYHWGTVPATDTTGSKADSIRIPVETFDNLPSTFWVRAVSDANWAGASRTERMEAVLLVDRGSRVYSKSEPYSPVEAAAEVLVSGSVMGYGRAIDNIAPNPPAAFRIDKDGDMIRLFWSTVTRGVDGTEELYGIRYRVYSHDRDAYFNPLTQGTLEATVDDTSMMLSTEHLRKFYCVLAVDSDNASAVSPRKGTYGFALSRGEINHYNYLSLPLENETINSARDLAEQIGEVEALLKLEHATNGFSRFYLPAISYGDNFATAHGMPVLVSLNPSAAPRWFYTGSVPPAGSVQFVLNKDASGTRYNEIILPLDRSDITTADQLAREIGGVEAVLKIDPETNGFSVFWLPEIQYGANFEIEPGEPVLIGVNASAPDVWPQGQQNAAETPQHLD